MIAKSLDRLLSEDAVAVMMRELLPLAAVVTPNAPEAEALTGRTVRTEADAREAARRLHDMGPRAVIVKGGHLDTPDVVDVLFDGHEFHEARGPRHATRHTHGTGCTFAAAIAAHLARGQPLVEAFRFSRAYLDGAIRHAPGLGHGAGPVEHFWNVDARRPEGRRLQSIYRWRSLQVEGRCDACSHDAWRSWPAPPRSVRRPVAPVPPISGIEASEASRVVY